MRVIGGRLKGTRITPPLNLPVRPTTDMAKEALFNILANSLDFEEIAVLDLFSGTGSISLEFASREVKHVTAVDKDPGCYKFLCKTIAQHQLSNISPHRADVFKFLEADQGKYDVVFADPPFDHPDLLQVPDKVLKRGLLRSSSSLMILEHPSMKKLDGHANFIEQRVYGYSSFSFFRI